MLWNSIQIFSVPLDCIYSIWFELRVNAVDMLACPCVYVTRSSETKPEEPWALAAEGGGQRGHLPCPWNLKKLTSYAIGARRGNLGSNLLVDAFVAKWYCDICYTKYAYFMFGFYWVRHLHKADTPLISLTLIALFQHSNMHTSWLLCWLSHISAIHLQLNCLNIKFSQKHRRNTSLLISNQVNQTVQGAKTALRWCGMDSGRGKTVAAPPRPPPSARSKVSQRPAENSILLDLTILIVVFFSPETLLNTYM